MENNNDAIEYLKSIIETGNEFVIAGDNQKALQEFSKGVKSFYETQHIKELWPYYQTLWHNKGMIHQAMKQSGSAQEAFLIATKLEEKLMAEKDK